MRIKNYLDGNVCKNIPVLALLLIICIGIVILDRQQGKNQSSTKAIFAMDTYMELTAYGSGSEAALAAAELEIRRLDALLSTGNSTSEIARLNTEKSGVLSQDSCYLLERSIQINELTEGAFDITIYPVMEAWGFAGEEFRVPDDKELSELLQYVDMSVLEYSKETGELKMPQHTKLDFGGIGKGYTSQRVTELMREYDLEGVILNLGGNVQTFGEKPDKSDWKIAVKSPENSVPYLGILSVKDKAVVTSGGYERYFEEDGVAYHHIIDPRTGKPAQSGLMSVTVVCRDGTLADGLSTALYVLGRDKAVALWQQHSDEFDLILLDEQGKLYVTSGLENAFMSELEYEIIY